MGKSKVILLLLVALVFSCKSTKEFYTNDGKLRNISDAKLINSVESNYTEYSNIFFKKFKAEVSFNGEKKSFKGNLFLQKDSSIVVSINPLMGIELFRVKLSPNKVEIIDRPKKKYSAGNYQILWDKFMIELDYETVQRILLNELYTYPITRLDDRYIKRYKHDIAGDHYQLKSVKSGRMDRKYRREKTEALVLHEFSILPEIFKVSKSYIKDFGVNSEVTIDYSNFVSIHNQFVPSLLSIKGQRDQKAFSMIVKFENIELNSENSIGFKVSSRYEKINF